MVTNTLDYLEQTALRLPEKIALADDKLSLTFSQWVHHAESIGTAIAQATNSTIRRAVLVFVDRRIEGLVGAMGAVESGNFYVPVDCKMPFERVRLIADVCKPIAAVATTEADLKTLDQIEFAGPRFLYYEVKEHEADKQILSKIREQIIDLDPVYSIFTSGSTGVPKGVVISHRGMIDLADWLVETFQFTEADALGNQTPFYFDGSVKDICICLKSGATLKASEQDITALNITSTIDVEKNGKIAPQLEKFAQKYYKANDGRTYSYSEYQPQQDNKKNALVIWLHGAGEGGTDTSIDLLTNEVTAFAGDKFQSELNNAYVITPQCPTMWMDGGNKTYQNGDKGSIYAKGLFDLIDNYVKNNSDIDTNRIYIGGCSNGGYMTMEMILKHPDYFAAAFPICEAFYDEYITDKQIQSLKNLPIWFTYAKTDTTVDFTKTTEPTVKRLLAAGNKNVHVSAFDDVHDTSGLYKDANGNPYEYNGHWSWIYWDNNECFDSNGVNAWNWLGQQAKKTVENTTPVESKTTSNVSKPTTSKTSTKSTTASTKAVKTGDSTSVAGLIVVFITSLLALIFLRKMRQNQ